VFSDGIVESTNSKDDEYGETRLTTVIEENFTRSVEDIRASVLASVDQFAAGVPPADDLTFLVVRFEAAAAPLVAAGAGGSTTSA
jgi:phosphoserine phosphatase RsbU/P